MTSEQLIDMFLLATKARNLSSRTIQAYSGDLHAFVSFLGSVQIVEVSVALLREYLSKAENNGLCSSSIRRRLATLKCFYCFLEHEGIVALSPTKRLTGRFRTPTKLPRVMSSQDVVRLLQTAYRLTRLACKGTKESNYRAKRNYLIVEILFSTGIRIDEMVKLNICDIDAEAGSFVIYGKGRKERLLFISSKEVLREVRCYLGLRSRMSLDTDALLLNRFNQRLSIYSIGKIFRYLTDRANIYKKYTPHCLRHTMATMLIDNGADLRSVQEILGHTSISTTERYITVTNKRKKEVFERFNQRNSIRLR